MIGAGLLGAGLLTGNQNLQNTGGALVKLGLASKLAAHFLWSEESGILRLKVQKAFRINYRDAQMKTCMNYSSFYWLLF